MAALPTPARSVLMNDGVGPFSEGRYGKEYVTITFSTSAAGDTATVTSKFGKKIVEIDFGLGTYVIAAGGLSATLTLRAAAAAGTQLITLWTDNGR